VSVAFIVLAKAPEPGRSKTRLSPPCTPEQAAELAAAALVDTLAAADAAATGRRVVALDGDRAGPVPAGWEVIAQRGRGLDERIAHAFEDVGGPALLVGMDTPQVGPALLSASARALLERGVDAVLGPAIDGGYWAIGMREPGPAAVVGVPMSSATTGAAQLARLGALGLRVRTLPVQRDVDTIADARAVAAAAPRTRFAATLAAMPLLGLEPVGAAP
jgi:rSAM/selenodomain-associated transferase 1